MSRLVWPYDSTSEDLTLVNQGHFLYINKAYITPGYKQFNVETVNKSEIYMKFVNHSYHAYQVQKQND